MKLFGFAASSGFIRAATVLWAAGMLFTVMSRHATRIWLTLIHRPKKKSIEMIELPSDRRK